MNTDMPVAVRDGIDTRRLSEYLRSKLDLSDEFELLQFPGGHSNMAYLLKWPDRELVLKRAPPGPKAKSAHDMGREYRVLSALHGTYPFAPRAYDYCEDDSIVGSPFCVMERISGVIVRREYEPGTPEAIKRAQLSGLLDALSELHAVDIRAVGLEGFGRPQGYTRRQLEGWSSRYDAAKTDDAADFGEVLAWLAARLPTETGGAAVIHNDFKLDNLVWRATDPTRLIGVLDWEMSTVGDPLMDLACTLSFWVEPGDPPELLSLRNMPTLSAGAPSRAEALEHYSRRTCNNLRDIAFYLCFGYFRRAVIEQQKYVRFVRGLSTDQRYANLHEAVRILHEMCRRAMSARY